MAKKIKTPSGKIALKDIVKFAGNHYVVTDLSKNGKYAKIESQSERLENTFDVREVTELTVVGHVTDAAADVIAQAPTSPPATA